MTAPDVLPEGWRWVRFGDVVRQVKDRVDPDTAGVERYVAGEHMDTDDLRIRRWGTVGSGYLGPAFHMRFRPGHVLYGSRRTYLRKIAVAHFEGICANTTFVVERATEDLLPEFLPLVMTSEEFHAHSIGQSKGSVNPYINFKDLAWYEFALPPIRTQASIVEILRTTYELSDTYGRVSNGSRTLALAEAAEFLRPTRLFVPLGEVADVVGGVTKDATRKPSPEALTVPYLRVANVLRGSIDLSDLTLITVEPAIVAKLRLQRGDVLLNEGGDRDKLGRGWVWEGQLKECIHQNHVFRARLHDDRFSPLFVAWMANFGNAGWFETHGRQSTNLASISLTKIKQFPLPLLTDEERTHFDQVIRADLRLRTALDAAARSAESTRQSLLEGLMSGAINV